MGRGWCGVFLRRCIHETSCTPLTGAGMYVPGRWGSPLTLQHVKTGPPAPRQCSGTSAHGTVLDTAASTSRVCMTVDPLPVGASLLALGPSSPACGSFISLLGHCAALAGGDMLSSRFAVDWQSLTRLVALVTYELLGEEGFPSPLLLPCSCHLKYYIIVQHCQLSIHTVNPHMQVLRNIL